MNKLFYSKKTLFILVILVLLVPWQASIFHDDYYDSRLNFKWHWIWLQAPLWSYLSETNDCPSPHYEHTIMIPNPSEWNFYFQLLRIEWSDYGTRVKTGLARDSSGLITTLFQSDSWSLCEY